jgi:CBS domain-containing protein
MKVKDIAKVMTRPLISIGENETVDAAIKSLLEHGIGALPVRDAKGELVGIISERDLLRVCSSHTGPVAAAKVKDVMTKDVIVCVPEDDLNYVMGIMTQKSVRHVPIMVGKKLEGVISIRDIIDVRLEACQLEVRHLSDYISGGYI